MKSVPAPISLAGSQLGQTRHVCAFFNSDEEEYRVLLPFIKDGLKCGDKAVHVLNPEQRQDPSATPGCRRHRPGGRAAERAARASDQYGSLPSRWPLRSRSDAAGV